MPRLRVLGQPRPAVKRRVPMHARAQCGACTVHGGRPRATASQRWVRGGVRAGRDGWAIGTGRVSGSEVGVRATQEMFSIHGETRELLREEFVHQNGTAEKEWPTMWRKYPVLWSRASASWRHRTMSMTALRSCASVSLVPVRIHRPHQSMLRKM